MTTIYDLTIKYRGKLDHLDMEIILAHSLAKTREFVLSHPEHKLTSAQLRKFETMAMRRAKGEPIAYILRHKEFYGLDFVVNKHTLIPRPETELMVEQAVHEACNMKHATKNMYLIDIGTGSGNIIISIAKALDSDTDHKSPVTNFMAIDISEDALKVAKKNAKIHEVDKKIKLIQSDLLSVFIQDTRCQSYHHRQLALPFQRDLQQRVNGGEKIRTKIGTL